MPSFPHRWAIDYASQRTPHLIPLALAAFFWVGGVSAADFHPITSVTASSSGDLYPVANLIQGPGTGFAATEPHAQLGSGSSHHWVTAAPGGFPSDYITQTGKPVLVFDLGQDRALSEISVWGYTSSNANGVSEFSLRFASSAEGAASFGTSITYNPIFAPVIEDGPRQSFAFSGVVVARFVEFTCEDNFYSNGGHGPPGGGDRVGLGEVAFEDAVPNPKPVIEVAGLLDFGNPPTYPGPQVLPLNIANLGGDQALQITAATITPQPGDVGVFSISGIPLTIPAGDNDKIDITFDPGNTEGCFNAKLELTTNDPARPSVTVLLLAGINCAAPAPERPTFSVDGGTFTGSFQLALTTTTPGAFIIYTTDGSYPLLENAATLFYESPLTIDASVQVRAATVSGHFQSNPVTESYVRLAADLAAYTSEIPILIVENFAAGTIPNKGWSTSTQTGAGLVQPERQPAYLGIFDTDPSGGTASIASPPDTDSRIGIRVRGAFSSTWNPKPYSLETWKQTRDEDRDISPLGMPSDSDWILYFPHPGYDRTMLGNTFIWELGGQTGRYGTRFRFVDVFVNEDGGDLKLADRRGVYAFAEKVKRGADRIDFEALSADGSTGGWLLGINRMDPVPAAGYPTENGATSPQFFHTPGPNRIAQTAPNSSGQGDDIPRQYNAFINFESPNGYRINTAQRATVENWFTEFENVFYDDSLWLDPVDGYRRYVNTTDLITYFQLLNLGKQGDGMLLSMFPWVSSGERQLHMGPMWDFNNGAYSGSTTSPLYFRSDRLWYPRLFQDPSFLREYIDRWFELRRGPLADTNMHAIIDRQSAEMPDTLVPAQGVTLGTWQSRVAGMKNWLSARAAWIDGQYFAPPDFSDPGGVVGPGFAFTLTNNTGTAGTIYYTTDGSDPVAGGGSAYTAPVALAASAEVRARTQSGDGDWSATNAVTYVVGTPADDSKLVISEIMYHPADSAGDEFIELLNIHPSETIDLTGAAFTAGIDYPFTAGTTLAPGERLLITQTEFQNDTRLANGGERIVLSGADASTIRDFTYSDKTPWPESADGDGFSLVLIDPASNPPHGEPTSWRRSRLPGGSPGASDAESFSGDPDADDDRDGVSALIEHSTGSSDALPGDAKPLAVSYDPTDGALLVEIRVNPAAEDVELALERSHELGIWEVAADAHLVSQSIDSSANTLELWHLPVPATPPGSVFVRLRVALK